LARWHLVAAARGRHLIRTAVRQEGLQATLTKNLRAVQLLLGHSKLESTVRYLGIEVDDALEISD
jgi:site-specific recombinase XerC